MQNNLAGLLPILIAVAIVGTVIKAAYFSGQRRTARYQMTPIMTGNEIEFFGRLRRALPEHHVFPQVAMSAVIKPVATYNQDRGAYNAINKKRIDYAVYDKDMKLIALVELDDKMHDAERDRRRDAITASAGVRTVRWNSKAKPNEVQIAQELLRPSGRN